MKRYTATTLATLMLLGQAGIASAYEISDRFAVNTLVEVEAFDTDDAEGDFSGADGQDIELATVELGLEARPTERLSAHVLFLFEEGETDPPELDEGTVSLVLTDVFGLTAGKEYVPFGSFETLMVNDPQTLELGETNETVIQLDLGSGAWNGAIYAYSGDTSDRADGDAFEGIGAGINYAIETTAMAWVFGASVISNLGDSDVLQDLEGGGEPGTLRDSVPGLGLHAMATAGPLIFIAEHIRALDDFVAGDFGGAVAAASQPSATNLEVGFELAGGWTLAGSYQRTDEAVFAGLPETVLAASLGYQVSEHVGVSVEVNSKKDYDLGDGGTDEDSSTIIGQLAFEF